MPSSSLVSLLYRVYIMCLPYLPKTSILFQEYEKIILKVNDVFKLNRILVSYAFNFNA